ncbi:MAG: hypothetical protein RL007_2857, partial [Bacteroidota bacterium]
HDALPNAFETVQQPRMIREHAIELLGQLKLRNCFSVIPRFECQEIVGEIVEYRQ